MARLSETFMVKPVLVFGYGNLSRGDDALGPLVLEYLEAECKLDQIDLLCDFQLQIEHTLDLVGRELIIFVDASVACKASFHFNVLTPIQDLSYTTHAMSPNALLAVYQSIKAVPPPPSFLLSIQAEKFELGDDLSAKAQANLLEACVFAAQRLEEPSLPLWLDHVC